MASSPRGSVIVEASVPTTPTPPPPVLKPTPKQDELNNKVNIANEILVALYRKRELGQMSENHRNEIKIREANLKELKKKLHEAKLNQMRQNKLRDVAICRIARYTLLTAEQKLSLLQIPGVRHEHPETRQRVRPQRIAARRQGELLCALAMQ